MALALALLGPRWVPAQPPVREHPAAVVRERALLDAYLRIGRTSAGPRATAATYRGLYSTRVPNPFPALIREGSRLAMTDDQLDTLAVSSRNFMRAADTIWMAVGRELDALPVRYDLDTAWALVSAGYTALIDRVITMVESVKRQFSAEQMALLPPASARLLDTVCLRSLHPTGAPTGRIGGAGALGLGRPGC